MDEKFGKKDIENKLRGLKTKGRDPYFNQRLDRDEWSEERESCWSWLFFGDMSMSFCAWPDADNAARDDSHG